MKKIILVFAFALLSFSIHAQETLEGLPEAKVSQELYISFLDMESTATSYVANISGLELASEEAAERFFSHFWDKEHVQFTVLFGEQKVRIDLTQPESTDGVWTARNWGTRFKMHLSEERKEKGFVDYRKL
ncbi:MAG: hypothetical protein AAF740_01265 [Bacteroidota bacterium]